MGAVHVRTPKNFVLEERLERYADAIETNPEAYAGDWRKACAPAGSKPFEHLHLDLGCGKGTYLVERAAHEPNTLFIGMDQEPICIAYAAQKICEQELANALVLPRGAASLPQLFAAGELDAITINFPTPQPKAKYAKKTTRPCRPSNALSPALCSRRHRNAAHRQQTIARLRPGTVCRGRLRHALDK